MSVDYTELQHFYSALSSSVCTHIHTNIVSHVFCLLWLQNLKSKTDEEIQLHMETENFLTQQYQVFGTVS